jgi:hypothetical protein
MLKTSLCKHFRRSPHFFIQIYPFIMKLLYVETPLCKRSLEKISLQFYPSIKKNFFFPIFFFDKIKKTFKKSPFIKKINILYNIYIIYIIIYIINLYFKILKMRSNKSEKLQSLLWRYRFGQDLNLWPTDSLAPTESTLIPLEELICDQLIDQSKNCSFMLPGYIPWINRL